MLIKFFNLNTWKGKYIKDIIKHVKKKKYDLINFQEVAGGIHSYTTKDNFADYKKAFPMNSELVIRGRNTGDKTSYFGNATFYNNGWKLLRKEVVWMQKKVLAVTEAVTNPIDYPYNFYSLLLQSGRRKFYLINTHLIWESNPNESRRRENVNQILVNYIKTLKHPFILSGDFNITANNPTVEKLDSLANNLLTKNKIKNTLNLRVHTARKKIPKPGLAVDFIYVSKHFKQKNLKVHKKLDLSDHFGIETELDFVNHS
ncbi:MAG: hypothetical protein COT91_01815 [Candidatus Doudnabacteria bacterium CG10_big_fil_rev_8_21_14_0_10_41_10]|uniref:Endonuclease/exonuclease/phosphatase domain-containing protein n=1 Tax=Candidatus Doudnabacteria bacterium CG10_big_fil_rev_8_21_14_0_10_41_10 TaxID=1974551 RepID=A0A2H0VGE9_9BACT|nr:MAG: hypothetical protein COT91_01815 [Candidatus Doudnabacteria bacterium CG10_big_fil_rev_8_21_14_0_10_41_10]